MSDQLLIEPYVLGISDMAKPLKVGIRLRSVAEEDFQYAVNSAQCHGFHTTTSSTRSLL